MNALNDPIISSLQPSQSGQSGASTNLRGSFSPIHCDLHPFPNAEFAQPLTGRARPLPEASLCTMLARSIEDAWLGFKSKFLSLCKDDLVTSTKNGDMDRVRGLLFRGYDVNAKGGDNATTPLQAAFDSDEDNHIEMIQLLLQKGATSTIEGQSMFVYVLNQNNAELIQKLLENRIISPSDDTNNESPIQLAVQRYKETPADNVNQRSSARNIIFHLLSYKDNNNSLDVSNILEYVVDQEIYVLASELIAEEFEVDGLTHKNIRKDIRKEMSKVCKKAMKKDSPEAQTFINKMIELDIDPNITDDHGSTLLSYAFKNKNQDMALALVRKGARLRINEDGTGTAPELFNAMQRGWDKVVLEVIRHFPDSATIQRVCNPDSLNSQRSVMAFACASGNMELLNCLIEHQVAPYATSHGGSFVPHSQQENHLRTAISDQRWDIASRLIDLPQIREDCGNSMLSLIPVYRFYMLDPNDQTRKAARDFVVKAIENMGLKFRTFEAISGKQTTLLNLAVQANDTELVDLLAQKSDVTDIDVKEALKFSYEIAGRLAAYRVNTLFQRGRGNDSLSSLFNDITLDQLPTKSAQEQFMKGFSSMPIAWKQPLYLSNESTEARHQNNKIGSILPPFAYRIYAMSMVEESNENINIYFLHAAERGDLFLIDFLIQKGAQIQTQDSVKKNALHYAISCNQKAVIEYLARQDNASELLRQEGPSGHTPLNAAIAGKKDPEIIEALLKTFPGIATIPKTRNGGNTPLHILCMEENRYRYGRFNQINHAHTIAELLLKYGADPKIQNNDQKTPLDLLQEGTPDGDLEKALRESSISRN